MVDTRICPLCGYGMDDFDTICDDCRMSAEDEAREDDMEEIERAHQFDHTQAKKEWGGCLICAERTWVYVAGDYRGYCPPCAEDVKKAEEMAK